jgi:hypothetical protein
MTDMLAPAQPVDATVRRCCEQHPDWPTLAQHLVDDFPDVSINEIVRQLTAAREAVDGMAVEEAEALVTAELITRQQLLLLDGQLLDSAKL